jgi:hypothetical protein
LQAEIQQRKKAEAATKKAEAAAKMAEAAVKKAETADKVACRGADFQAVLNLNTQLLNRMQQMEMIGGKQMNYLQTANVRLVAEGLPPHGVPRSAQQDASVVNLGLLLCCQTPFLDGRE